MIYPSTLSFNAPLLNLSAVQGTGTRASKSGPVLQPESCILESPLPRTQGPATGALTKHRTCSCHSQPHQTSTTHPCGSTSGATALPLPAAPQRFTCLRLGVLQAQHLGIMGLHLDQLIHEVQLVDPGRQALPIVPRPELPPLSSRCSATARKGQSCQLGNMENSLPSAN